MNYWYSPRVKGGRKCLIFYAPEGPSARQLNNVFITLQVFGPPASPRRPRPRRRRGSALARESRRFSASFMGPQIKVPWLEAGLPERCADDPRAASSHRTGLAERAGRRAGRAASLLGSPPQGPRDGIRAAREATAPQPPAT